MNMVRFHTNYGLIDLRLFEEEAPLSVQNFLQYVRDGFYQGTIFHRVIPGFMIQGGGFTETMQQKKNRDPIENEAKNGLKNLRGTLSMARTNQIHSATSQFFINVADNAFLDHGERDYGYAVFAKVEKGMEVVDAIARVKTGILGPFEDVPKEPIIITLAEVVESA